MSPVPLPRPNGLGVCEKRVGGGQGSRGGRILRGDPSLIKGQEVQSLEGGVGGDGVRLLDSRLAVPESPPAVQGPCRQSAVDSAGWKGCSTGKVEGGVVSK